MTVGFTVNFETKGLFPSLARIEDLMVFKFSFVYAKCN
jgi:hypothetical protein